jgi:2-methylcitrate dehydratase PrpD
MDMIFKVAEHIVKADYNDLPDQAVEVTKRFILDTLGTSIAGSTASGTAELVNQIRSWGGSEESTLLAYGGKVPSIHATFVNSYMAHARDFDDSHGGERAGAHCNVTVMPPAIALSEQVGGKSGKDLITAVALGVDLVARLNMSANFFHGWHYTSVMGIFGATASAGKILGLTSEQLVNAFGIAFCQACGNRQGRKDGALTKRLQVAFSSKAGAHSALLARIGMTGAQNILGGEWGFYRLYRDPDSPFNYEASIKILTDDLGRRFEGIHLSAKPYPSCRGTHAPIDAVEELISRHQLGADDVEEVIVYVSESMYETVGAPFAVRTNPQVDAQFSIPYTVAVFLIKGEVKIRDFEVKEILENREVLNMAERVKVKVDPAIRKKAKVPVRVEIRTKDGKTYSHQVDVVKGDPGKSLSYEEFAGKFRDCAEYAARPLGKEKIGRAIDMVHELEKLKDIGELVEQLT